MAICIKQMQRFSSSPIIVTLENDYRSWVYPPMAITLCPNYIEESSLERLIQQYSGVSEDCDLDTFEEYRQYFEAIGSLNAGNIQSFDRFEDTEMLSNLTGDDLMFIATEVGF